MGSAGTNSLSTVQSRCWLAARTPPQRPTAPPPPSPCAQVGLSYICATAERFFAVGAVLSSMVTGLAEQPSVRLLKHIIRCYLRLRWAPGGGGGGGRGQSARRGWRWGWGTDAARWPTSGRPFCWAFSPGALPLLPPCAATTRGRGRRCGSACPTCCATRRWAQGLRDGWLGVDGSAWLQELLWCHPGGCSPHPRPPPHVPPAQFTGCLKDDVTTRRWLAQLLVNVGHLQDAAALGTDVVGPTPPV